METLKTSLEAVLTTIQKLPEKDALVIFLFVRNVVEAVEAYLATNQTFDIESLLTDCCIGFQQADDVIVQRKDESIQVDTVLEDQVTQSYQLYKNKVTILSTETAEEETEESPDKDESYYVSLPASEGGEGPGSDPPQTVLECSDPSVLQAFLEEGGKLPSYLPPGTQIIIETEDGRTEVLENTAVDPQSVEQQKAIEAIQDESSEPLEAEAGDISEPLEAAGTEAGTDEAGDIPVFVMTEEGEMLISPDQIENIPELKQQLQEVQGEKRKHEGSPRLEQKKLKIEDFDMSAADEELDTEENYGVQAKVKKTPGGTFQCDRCFQCFSHEHSLHRHYRAQHLQMKWSCDTCGRDFTRADSLVNHKKKGACFKGPGNKKFSVDNETFIKGQGYLCITCDMYFKTATQLRKHQDKCHNTEKHACTDCGKWFQSAEHLSGHRNGNQCVKGGPGGDTSKADSEERDADTTLESEADNSQADSDSRLEQITTVKSGRRASKQTKKDLDDLYLCQECGQCLTSKTALQIHMRKHTGIVPFKCQFCGHGTNSRANLLRHLENIHGVTKDSPISLDLRDYSKDEDDGVHMRSHTKEHPFKCDHCDKRFGTSANKTRHEQTVHEGRRDWECDVCGKKYSEKKTMVNHKKTAHDGERPYSCDVCFKTFTQKNGLNTHMITHSARIPAHECTLCDRKFMTESLLQTHIKQHQETDDVCELCDLSFVNKTDYRRHLRTAHSEPVELVTCDLCSAKFKTKEEFTAHINDKHTKSKGYYCTLCEGVSFYSSKSLDKHMQKTHPECMVARESQSETSDNIAGVKTEKSLDVPSTPQPSTSKPVTGVKKSIITIVTPAKPKLSPIKLSTGNKTITGSNQDESSMDMTAVDDDVKKESEQKLPPGTELVKFPRVVLSSKEKIMADKSLVETSGGTPTKRKFTIVKGPKPDGATATRIVREIVTPKK